VKIQGASFGAFIADEAYATAIVAAPLTGAFNTDGSEVTR